jgi:L-aminopeptidase/D-esterase-like protein
MPGLTRVAGVTVGHFTDTRRPTGCTVVLTAHGAVCGVDVRGGAPGTRETDLLDPTSAVSEVHGIVLAGGSAFGLDAASGVVRFLEERGVGFAVGSLRIPLVPAAILFDLAVGDPRIRPDANAGYAAASAANAKDVPEGSVGAGTGATVGKWMGAQRAMKGGLGTASIERGDGLIVAALVVVNAVGDVVDPTSGAVVAGARSADGGSVEGTMKALIEGVPAALPTGTSTTLGVVATNATLTKAQATKVAQMAQDGFARTIRPVHTPWDGDTIFALATGELALAGADMIVGALAAEVVAEAVLRGIRAATGLAGLPAARDLAGA